MSRTILRKFLSPSLVLAMFFLTCAVLAQDEADKETLSPVEIIRMIDEAGRTKPDWWDSTPLEYPKTLDIQGTSKVKGWRPDVNIGAYIWQTINQKPANWLKGARFMYYVIEQRGGNPALQGDAMGQLGNILFNLLQDYPRAAYWYQRSMKLEKRHAPQMIVNLAECYWRIGSKALAMKTLSQYGLESRQPYMASIKLISEMGDFTRAIALAKKLAGSPRRADEGLLSAGNACRYVGRLDEAAEWYRKALELKQGSRYLKLHQKRAGESLAGVEALKTLDISLVADGTFNGSSLGYRGDVEVEVTVADGKIAGVKVTKTREDVFYGNFKLMPQRIVDSGNFQGVDAVSGASTTSDAIINASIKALDGAAKKAGP